MQAVHALIAQPLWQCIVNMQVHDNVIYSLSVDCRLQAPCWLEVESAQLKRCYGRMSCVKQQLTSLCPFSWGWAEPP